MQSLDTFHLTRYDRMILVSWPPPSPGLEMAQKFIDKNQIVEIQTFSVLGGMARYQIPFISWKKLRVPPGNKALFPGGGGIGGYPEIPMKIGLLIAEVETWWTEWTLNYCTSIVN